MNRLLARGRQAGSPNPRATRARSRRRRQTLVQDFASTRVLLAGESGLRTEQLAELFAEAGYRVVVVHDGYALLNAWTFAWLSLGRQPFGAIVAAGPLPLMSADDAILELRTYSDCHACCFVDPCDPDADPTEPDEIVALVCDALPLTRLRRLRGSA